MILAHALLSSKNVRFLVSADPFARLLVAAFVVGVIRGKRWTFAAIAAGILVDSVVELKIFYDVFVVSGVYDPVTYDVLRALKMLPR
jgi:hypothetical protein